jgi:hypothetical protein
LPLLIPSGRVWLRAAGVLAALSVFPAGLWAEPPKLANSLASETGAYLRSAVHQPVHWQPWGERAFELARSLNRPILLDIGAIWCHWCHVMDRESYDTEKIALLINRDFVPVKVDRDERPDVDRRYQTAVASMFGVSGWPLTVVLTPTGEVIFGGTYFPPEDRDGRAGLTTLLGTVAELYRENPEAVVNRARSLATKLAQLEALSLTPGRLTPALRDSLIAATRKELDPTHGGFPADNGAQFPRPSALAFLLRGAVERNDPELLSLVTKTLDRMALGGIHDQLAGGFHRYTVDRNWRVPHFEKMTGPNAEILHLYLQAYQATGKPLYRQVAEGIIRFAEGLWEDGGFAASQDADGPDGLEGTPYTWTWDEIGRLISTEEAQVARLAFGLSDRPGLLEGQPDRNILARMKSAEEVARETGRPVADVQALLSSAERKLAKARAKRLPARIDRTRYTDVNGLMIRSWLEASVVLGRDGLKTRALLALERIIKESYSPGRGIGHLPGRQSKGERFLDDQVFVAEALMVAFQATAEPRWLGIARDLLEYARRALWDEKQGGFFDHLPTTKEGLLAEPTKLVQDFTVASGNGTAALALLRLYHLTSDATYRQWAEETLKTFAGSVGDLGSLAGSYSLALDVFLTPPAQVAIVGPKGHPATDRLWKAALKTFRPEKVVLLVDSTDQAAAKDLPPAIQAKLETSASKGAPEAYVCAGNICSFPTGDASKMEQLIRTFGQPGLPVLPPEAGAPGSPPS